MIWDDACFKLFHFDCYSDESGSLFFPESKLFFINVTITTTTIIVIIIIIIMHLQHHVTTRVVRSARQTCHDWEGTTLGNSFAALGTDTAPKPFSIV